MKHNYKELNNTLFAALDNIPEEKSISLRELISMCFPDYKYVSSFYSEDTKKHHNPYSFFNGEKWEKLELLDFAFDFFKTAKKSKFFLDGTKYTGGFYGTPENMSFFVRRKPISKRIIFQVQEYPVKNEVEESKTKQLKIYYLISGLCFFLIIYYGSIIGLAEVLYISSSSILLTKRKTG